MAIPLVWFLAGLAAPKLYNKLVRPEGKRKWQEKVGLHHGEAGVLMLLGGAATRNPGLAAFGTGLIIEDWTDRNEWFKKR